MREISAFWTCKLWRRIIVPPCCWQVQTLDKCLTKSAFAASCRSCVCNLTVFSTQTPHLEQPARPLKEKQRRSLAPFLSIVGPSSYSSLSPSCFGWTSLCSLCGRGTGALPNRHSLPKLGFLWFIKLGYYNFFQMKASFGKKPPEDDTVLATCGPKVSLYWTLPQPLLEVRDFFPFSHIPHIAWC